MQAFIIFLPNNSVAFVSLLNSFTDFHCYRTRCTSIPLIGRFLSISTSNFSHKKIGFFLIFEYLKYICAMSIENEKHGCL